jgi:hypothetical protein
LEDTNIQVFSPYPSFIDISNCLDKRRLFKQKVEIYQIFNCIALGDKAKGWKNHPAVSMVRGYELFFIDYGLEIANSCSQLGYKDTLIPKIKAFKDVFQGEYKKPWYWGNEKFHLSHKSNLIRKFPEHYRKFWPDVPDNLPYFWPTKNL